MQKRSGIRVFTQKAVPALRPFVKQFLVVDFPEVFEDSHLPGTSFVAAFPFRGSCHLNNGQIVERAALTGLHNQIRHHKHSGGSAIVLAQFTTTGASAFFRQNMGELIDTTVPMEELLAKAGALTQIEEQLTKLPNHFRRIQCVENFLLTRIENPEPDPLIAAAVRWIENAPPGSQMKNLVRHIGLSQSALERRFQRVVGTTPKKFASLVRLQRILHLHSEGNNLTAIAHAAGYHDQAHFTHEFKKLAGVPPRKYFDQAS